MSSHKDADLSSPELYATILYTLPREYSFYRSDKAKKRHGHHLAMPHLKTDRIPRFLDILSRIVISDPEQVAATTVQIEPDPTTGKLKTCVYVAYNHDLSPELKIGVVKHINDIFLELKSINVPGNLGASAGIQAMGTESSRVAIELSSMINAFSSRVLLSCIGKRIDMLDRLEEELKMDTDTADKLFSPEDLRVIADVIAQLRLIHATTGDIQEVSKHIGLSYSIWTESRYLPLPTRALDEDEGGDEDRNSGLSSTTNFTWPVHPAEIWLFRRIEMFMARRPQGIYFPMERWIAKFASAYRWSIALMQQRLSKSFKEVYDGSITFTIVPTPTPQHKSPSLLVDLDRDNLSRAISSIRQDFADLKTYAGQAPYVIGLDDKRCDKPLRKFIEECLFLAKDRPRKTSSTHSSCPSQSDDTSIVHCELTMLSYIHSRNISAYNYIGTSTPSCTMCDLYLSAFGRMSQKRYFVRSHRKIDPTWAFPLISPQGSALAPRDDSGQNLNEQDTVRDNLTDILRKALADHFALVIEKALREPSDPCKDLLTRELAAKFLRGIKKRELEAKYNAALAQELAGSHE